jgi:hypothetical protein
LRKRFGCDMTPYAVPRLSHAEAFLRQMLAVTPARYRIELDGDILGVINPDGGKAGLSSYWLTSDVLLAEEALEGGVQSLHQIQREIAEDTTEPWPAVSGPGYRGFPEPDGAIVGDELRLWFGDRADPVLVLEPIDLSQVLLRD